MIDCHDNNNTLDNIIYTCMLNDQHLLYMYCGEGDDVKKNILMMTAKHCLLYSTMKSEGQKVISDERDFIL